MAASRTVRFACIGAVAALGLTLAYWAAMTVGGPFFLLPPGGHDGGYCSGRVANAQPGVEYSVPCGVSMTPEFVVALAALVVATGAASVGIARGGRRPWQVALSASALAFGITVFETAQRLGGTGAAGLNGLCGPIHVTLVGAATLAFGLAARAPRNPESAATASPTTE